MKQDSTVPFDPTNKKHLKGFVRGIKKLAKKYKKVPNTYLVIESDVFAELSRLSKKI